MRPPMRLATAVLVCCLLLPGCTAPQRPGPGDGTVPTPPPPAAPPAANLADVRIALHAVASGFDQPLYVTDAGDGSGRLFVVEQGGVVKVLRNGAVAPLPFLDLRGRITSGGERGLLSIAFEPAFKERGRFYADYTDLQGNTVVSRFLVRSPLPDQADPSSEEALLHVEQPYANHNGGLVLFGPDGMLYVGLGDGGSGGDPQGNGQNKEALLGKLLRLDVSTARGFAVPPSNPFVGKAGRDEVWAWGLRNPWRFSFDRATRDLFIADVGQNQAEEVDFQPANSTGGENYGWNVWEASQRYRSGDAADSVVFPVAEYSHAGGACSVTGGYVYRGAAIPALQGTYLYGDYCSGVVWGLQARDGAWATRQLLDTDLRISSFGEDAAGEVYVVDHGGTVYRVDAA